MTVVEEIVGKLEALPPEIQRELLDFAEFLASRYGTGRPLRSSRGLWADLGIEITEDDIKEMRREAWANFPREDLL